MTPRRDPPTPRRRPRGRPDSGERGSGTLLITLVVGVLMFAVAAVAVVGGYAVRVQHARAGADLVALSGATAHHRGDDGCAAAREAAHRNDVALTECAITGDRAEHVVTVQVEAEVAVRVPGLPSRVSATAHAGHIDGTTAETS